jgi:hypothetical protein
MNMSELKFEEWWKEYSNSEESDECFNGVQDLKITALNAEQKKQIFAGIMVLLENVARKVWNTRKPDDAKLVVESSVNFLEEMKGWLFKMAQSHSDLCQAMYDKRHVNVIPYAGLETNFIEWLYKHGLSDEFVEHAQSNDASHLQQG